MNSGVLLALLGLTLGFPGAPGQEDARRGAGRVVVAQYRGPQRPSDEDRERARLRIGITKEQQAQIEQAFADTDRQMREVMGRLRDLYHQLNTVYDQYDYNRQQARALQRQIVEQRLKIMRLHADSEDRLRRILNKDQFERMRALMREEREKRHRDRPRAPGGPGEPGPRPG